MTDRSYEEEINHEAFGHEGFVTGRLYAPPGNGFKVIEDFFSARELEALGNGGLK